MFLKNKNNFKLKDKAKINFQKICVKEKNLIKI